MAVYQVETRRGKVAYVAWTPRPRMLLIHGFRRSMRKRAAWADRFPGLGFMSLPDHSGSPGLDETSVEAWIEAWRDAFRTLDLNPVLIGESLGAVVAMGLPSRATVAVEPLLSVDDIWPQHEAMAAAVARGAQVSPAEVALFDRPFDWILDRISAPTLVIAAEDPLMPRRPVERPPSLLSDADFARYAAHPRVEAHRIPGGHNLLDENPDGVVGLARPFLERHAPDVQSR